jgi:hypothetical protein
MVLLQKIHFVLVTQNLHFVLVLLKKKINFLQKFKVEVHPS